MSATVDPAPVSGSQAGGLARHTPGEWVVEVYDSLPEAKADHAFRWAGEGELLHGQRPACVWLKTGQGHTGLPGSIETTEANARLIAAAPELLEALKGLVRQIERPASEWDNIRIAAQEARAAIAKASGSEPDNKRSNGSSARNDEYSNGLNNPEQSQ